MSNKLPSYMKVYKELQQEIRNGKYQIGDMLPVESELEQMFGVSRITIRKAVKLLVEEKLVDVKQGRGTLVLDFKPKQSLNHVVSVTETLRQKGYDVQTQSMYIDIIQANYEIAEALQIPLSEYVARFQRIQLADGKPIVLMKNYVEAKMVPDVIKYSNKFTALYQFLEGTYQIHIDEASDTIYAKNAEFEEAQMLNIPVGEALLCIKRICYQDNKPVCYDKVKIIGSKYELNTSMMGRYHDEKKNE
ncbi:GntR family transcriptional regulator [Anaerosporobacter faecicola]|uniref:GntR family transcriptional regulator n=1 Tax=Anaerosporobacter faecicola TaxID=2718714 RepID=UPI00143B0FC5|nr:GntR family transcriptional regulator [Anaerosporobacter faecicola]